MKTTRKPKNVDTSKDNHEIEAYAQALTPELRALCDTLRELITKVLPKAASKIWHGSPVWFIDENPVVGYNATAKKTVNLLFWNGQALGDPNLRPVGKYQAAQAVFSNAAPIDPKMVRGWLKKAKANVFDAKAFFKKLREKRKPG